MKTGSIAFFFDADHVTLPGYYGPSCTGAVITALSAIRGQPDTQILRGDAILHRFCYEVSAISAEKGSRGGARVTQTGNAGLFKLAACEFVDSLSAGYHTFDQNSFLSNVLRKRIWTILASQVRLEDLPSLEQALRNTPAYLGCAEVDRGNPFQMDALPLLGGAFLSSGTLVCRHDPIEGSGDYLGYGYSGHVELLPPSDFDERAPKLPEMPVSERGALSLVRMSAREATHGVKVVAAIQRGLERGEIEGPISFDVPGGSERQFHVEEAKVRSYLLNFQHPKGASKAVFFRDVLRIVEEDWRYLQDQILHGVKKATLYRFKPTQFGFAHGAIIPLTGRNGRTVAVVSGWNIKADGVAHFVTAYPDEEETKAWMEEPVTSNESWIVSTELKGDKYFEALHSMADAAGKSAAKGTVPTPMLISGYAPIFAGACGVAWVSLPDARTKFCRWLARNNIGRRSYDPGWHIPARVNSDPPFYDAQSVEPQDRYAKAYAEVLKRNGVACTPQMLLD